NKNFAVSILLERIFCLCEVVQRFDIEAPAKCTMTSTPSKQAMSMLSCFGFQKNPLSFGFDLTLLFEVVKKCTSCPPSRHCSTRAFPTKPVAPVINNFICNFYLKITKPNTFLCAIKEGLTIDKDVQTKLRVYNKFAECCNQTYSARKFAECYAPFRARSISLFPGGPGSFFTENPTACIALLTEPFSA